MGLAALTREEFLPALQGYDASTQTAPVWGARLRRLEDEAKAFRPGIELSVTVEAPGSELASSATSGFVENRPATAERNRKLREAARARRESVRDQVKLNDFVAARWMGEAVAGTGEQAGAGGPDFEFSEAQTGTALRLLESWKSPGADNASIPRFTLVPASEPLPAVAPAAWVESVEQPRSLPEPDVEVVRARLSPALDFPVTGEPMIFYKVKGNAALEIAGKRDSGKNLAAIWGWFLGGLGLICLFARLTCPPQSPVSN
jgi:hypothetical protein